MNSKFFLAAALLALSARAREYIVAPEDGGDGILRAIAAASGEGGGEVVLKSGVYRLEGTLSFKAKHVKVRAAEKGGAVLSGAVPVGGWQKVEGKPWLKAKLAGADYFRSLVVNGKYAPRAEFPGGGKKLLNTNVWNVRWLSSIGNGWERQPTREESSTVFVKKGDIPETFDPASADVRVYHDWDDSLVRADKWFPDRLRLELKDPCRFPPGSFNRHGYVIYNTEEGMLVPGNWRFDAVEGVVYYWPREGETADCVKVETPKVVKLVEFANSDGVEFDGVVFECAKPPMQRSTFSGVGIDAAVTVKKSDNCAFKNCTFRNCGGIALRMADCPKARLEGNLFERSGSCALQANGVDLAMSGNRFLSSGLVFTSACACNLGGRNIRFLSNEIDGAPYCGVVFSGSGHLFESNVVRNIMQSLHDGAAFYGMGAETTFRRNRVYDNLPGERARHAFYFDEGARDGTIVDNYVEGGFRCCVLNHFAYNIVVSNNVFKTPGDQYISFSGSRWGTCVCNRFECGGVFAQMPSPHEVTNWAGNVFVEKGVEKEVPLSARPVKADAKPVPAPYTKSAPKIDGCVDAEDWPGVWSHATTAADGSSLHGTPRMFRACHDGTNLYVAVRAPHYRWEAPATNAAAGADWVRFRFAGGELELRADGAARASGVSPLRHYAGLEKTKKKGMGWAMVYQASLPLAGFGVSVDEANLMDFDVAIHDSLTGETRHVNPSCSNATPSTLRIEFPGRSPRWIDVLPMGVKSENPIADGAAYIFWLTPQGNPVHDRVTEQVKAFRKQRGMQTGALLQCTLGHGGGPGDGAARTPWQMMDWKWKQVPATFYKFCPLDPRFREYIVEQCRKIAAVKPDFFMFDDDSRMERGCYCPLHMAAYEKVKDKKSWEEFTDDTLADYVQLVRDCFPKEIPGMFCCVNCTAQSGARMARIAAGEGHTPILRLGGAPYWEEKKFDMLSMRALYARERELVADPGVALLMEADTCPHVVARTSATRYSEFLQMVALEGFTGAKMWITPTRPEKLKTEGVSFAKYKAVLRRDRAAIRYLTESAGKARAGRTPPDELGVKIVLGEKPAPFGVNDWGKSCLGRHGIPYYYGKWAKGDVVAITGDEVKYFSDDELRRFVGGPLLLDKAAAEEFAKRGFGEEIKAKNVETTDFTVYPYPQHYSRMASLYKSGKDDIVARLRRLDRGYVPGRVYIADYGSYHLATGFDREGARYILIDNLDVDIPEKLFIVTPWDAEGLEEFKDGRWQAADITRSAPKGKGGATALNGPFLPHRPRLFRKSTPRPPSQ
jgi:hypothetical protein